MKHQRGIWFGLAAYVFWGLTPIFWNLVSTDAMSLLLHRIVWFVPILFLIVGLVVFGESISSAEMFGFVAVWTALGIFSVDGSRNRGATR